MSLEHTYPFDRMAASYDATFTDTQVGRTLRGMVWRRLEARFAGCHRVLELGCGTGEDAMWLARGGAHVFATDASPLMIQEASGKAHASGWGERIELKCVAMEDLEEALAGQTFDAVLSNFGAINCVRDLPALAASLAAHVEPGGKLLWVAMGRTVPWEWAWYLARGQWRKAFRRLAPQGASWRGLRISYPTPRTLTQVLAPWFTTNRVSPLGLALPPSYAAGWLGHCPRALALLTWLEHRVHRWAALAHLSDHYIIEATRSAVPTVQSNGPAPTRPAEFKGGLAQARAERAVERSHTVGAAVAYARAHASKLLRFALVGGSVALLNLALLFCFREELHLPDRLAVTLMYMLGALVHFLANRQITYSADADARRQVPRYLAMLGWNFALLHCVVALAAWVSISPYLAVMAATGLTTVSNFLVMTHVVFASPERS